MIKISDFKFAETFIKQVCRLANVPFIDLPIAFMSVETVVDERSVGHSNMREGIYNGVLNIGNPKNLAHTSFIIVDQYTKNDNIIYGDSCLSELRDKSLSYFAATIKKALPISKLVDNEFFASRLYQKPLTYILLKDLICPVTYTQPKNTLIITGNMNFMDVAKYSNGTDTNLPPEPCICVNSSIETGPTTNAFILVEAIRSLGLCPVVTMRDILGSPLASKVVGAANLAFSDNKEKVEEFLSILITILDLDWKDYPHVWNSLNPDHFASVKGSGMIKSAQLSKEHPSMFWYFGLIEKMLETSRGMDWTTHLSLESYVSDFWKQVQDERQARGDISGVPFNELLRIKTRQTDSNITDTRKTLQSLLNDERIW